MGCGTKWLVNFNATKSQLVSLDRLIDSGGTIDVDGSVLDEKSSFKMHKLFFSSKLDLGSYIVSITKNWSLDTFYESSSTKVALYLYKCTICTYCVT